MLQKNWRVARPKPCKKILLLWLIVVDVVVLIQPQRSPASNSLLWSSTIYLNKEKFTEAMSAAAPVAGRIISRRAQALLKTHAPDRFPTSPPKPKSSKTDETSWPKGVRYTFYTVCVASVPFSIGTAISLSPKLREWMTGGDAPVDDGDDASRKLIRVVRQYWGTEDEIPFVDRPAAGYITPGSRKAWQEDNYSSFLHLIGLDETNSAENLGGEVPLSLENEPPANVRHDQELLDEFLSPITNPEGVKTRLTLLPCTDDEDVDNAGYDTECTLPANVSLDTLRQMCKGSDAQYTRKVLADSWPDFRLVSSNERLRTGSWSKDCRWVISFVDDESESEATDKNVGNIDDLVADIVVYGDKGAEAMTAGGSTSEDDNSDLLRKSTSIHSSWSYFPELANGAAPGPASSPLGTSMGASGRSVSASANQQQPSMSISNEDLRIQQLQHQITTLKQELNDPNSFRDRDSMYEELKQAKAELRSLKPWWRRIV